jgi:8-oxo-dGDP phosphatase
VTAADAGAGFRVEREDELWGGRIVRVCHLWLTDPSGVAFERDVVRHPGAVAIVALGDGLVSLVRQFRAPVGTSVLEVPAGTCDVAGEDPAETARRELAEEVGLNAAEMRILATTYNSPGYSDQVTTIFLATGLSQRATARAGIEEQQMTVETVALDEAHDLVAAGRIRDSTTIIGLMLAREEQRRRR